MNTAAYSAAGPALAKVLPFRRRQTQVRRRRQHPLRRFGPPFLVAFALVGGPVGVVAWIFHSPLFGFRQLTVEVVGAGRIDAPWVYRALRPLYGHNLPRLELAWVDRALRRHPWVKATEVRKELPSRLVVRVFERRAVALLRRAGGLDYLDEQGRVITAFEAPNAPPPAVADLILVSVPAGTEPAGALAMAREISAAAPPWAAGLSEIEALGGQDFRVWSSELPFPLLVRAGDLARKTVYLQALLPQIRQRYPNVEAVDLRFRRRIIVQPSSRAGEARAVPERGVKG